MPWRGMGPICGPKQVQLTDKQCLSLIPAEARQLGVGEQGPSVIPQTLLETAPGLAGQLAHSRHACAATARGMDQTAVLQHTIRARHRVQVDSQVGRQLSHCRQLGPRNQAIGCDLRPYPPDDLIYQGLVGIQADCEHAAKVAYYDTLVKWQDKKIWEVPRSHSRRPTTPLEAGPPRNDRILLSP